MATSLLFLMLFLMLLFLKSSFALTDSDALLILKESFNNSGNGSLDSWIPGSVPCNENGFPWEGLICRDGILKGLRLEGMGLSGKIDVDALVLMKDLRSFSVSNNSFSGHIPDINRLGALRALYLSKNRFSGEIPKDYFDGMGSLQKVWLSDNNFSGRIPASLSNVSHLIELHLENNRFSGEIPSGLSKFDGYVFAGNQGLCGSQIGVACITRDEHEYVDGGSDEHDMKKIITAAIVLTVMLLLLIIIIVIKWRKKKLKRAADVRNPPEIGSSNVNPEVLVSLPSGASDVEVGRKTGNTSSNGRSNSIRRGMARCGAVPELVMINDEKGVFGLTSLMKAPAQVLANGAVKSSYKATMAGGVSVVVKRTKEMNCLGKDEFDAGVKRLGNLKHPNVLTPLAYHYRNEEKLFVYEYLDDGSLLYQLHGDRRTSAAGGLDWPARLKIVQGIVEGLGYIHAELAYLDVPHGNLKSSNVLLGLDNHTFVSEYGFCSLVSVDGAESLFAYRTPEVLQHGKVCHKSDVYCLGIIILEILTGKFPSQYLDNDHQGGTDVVEWVASTISEGKQAELLDPEIASGSNSLRGMEKLLHIGSLCTQTSPDERIDLNEAIKMIQEIQVEGDEPDSDSQATTTIQVLPSSQDEYADAKSTSDTSSVREGDV